MAYDLLKIYTHELCTFKFPYLDPVTIVVKISDDYETSITGKNNLQSLMHIVQENLISIFLPTIMEFQAMNSTKDF